MQRGEDLSSCSSIRARGLCHHLRTSLQALVDALLKHPWTCWIPWSASRGASEKPFWYLKQAKVNFQPFPALLFQGPGKLWKLHPWRSSELSGMSPGAGLELQRSRVEMWLFLWWGASVFMNVRGSSPSNITCSWFLGLRLGFLGLRAGSCPVQCGGRLSCFPSENHEARMVLHEGRPPGASPVLFTCCRSETLIKTLFS